MENGARINERRTTKRTWIKVTSAFSFHFHFNGWMGINQSHLTNIGGRNHFTFHYSASRWNEVCVWIHSTAIGDSLLQDEQVSRECSKSIWALIRIYSDVVACWWHFSFYIHPTLQPPTVLRFYSPILFNVLNWVGYNPIHFIRLQ